MASTLIGFLAIPVLVLIAWYVYAPGQYGAFILDDYPNLGSLGQVKTLDNVDGLIRYLFSDIAGTPDRWLSKLSFLINDTDWPSYPLRFKQTNIAIHIINGLFVVWILLRLMRILGYSENLSRLVAVFTGAMWLLHPFNVSTTLYVVQRMTELSALFNFVGILLYLVGRAILTTNTRRGYTWVTTGVIIGTTLGFLSKENGALLPLYILVLESLLLSRYLPIPGTKSWVYWKMLFLYTPVIAIAAWQVFTLPSWLKTYTFREFDLGERVLSQAHALFDYLRSILIPIRAGTGVFHDDFPVSHGLLDPPITLIAVFAIVGLLLLAWRCRNRHPVLAFAIAWFFAGHVLESGILPLELYFEHRNYVAMVGPLFALAYYGFTAQLRLKLFLHVSLLALLCMTTLSTWQSARIWGAPLDTVEIWEREHPNSPRLLQYASNFYVNLGFYDESQKRLNRMLKLKPGWAGPRLKLLLISCISGENRLGMEFEDFIETLDDVEWDAIATTIIDNLQKGMSKKPCHMLDFEHIYAMLDKLMQNPSYQRRRYAMANLHLVRAKLNGNLNRPYDQAADLKESFRWKRNWHVATDESKVWATLGDYDKALEAVDRANSEYYLSLLGVRFRFQSRELESWKNYLEERRVANDQG